MKVFVFSDNNWSIGRVHHDIARNLPDIEFTFEDWRIYDRKNVIRKFNECDVCMAGILCVEFFKWCFPEFDHKKCLFISHGLEFNVNEHLDISHLTYGITSSSVRHFFPTDSKVFSTPNGVDPVKFNFKNRDGSINKIGWCGSPHIKSKQANWAIKITSIANIPFSFSSKVPCEDDLSKWEPLTYEEVLAWYDTIDLLLVTAKISSGSETGPLPAFEAIVSGIPVVGTPVGNFADVPGPKFSTIEEGIEIVNQLKSNPEQMKALAKDQYEYVMKNNTYQSFAHKWREALEYVYSQKTRFTYD